MELAKSCGRLIARVSGTTFVLSGKTYLNGVWETKDHCRRLIEEKGGVVKIDESLKMDVLVFGDLHNSPVLDRRNGMSEKVLFVFDQRSGRANKHIHVIDGLGLHALLSDRSAVCLDLQRADGSEPIRAYRSGNR